MRVKVDCDDAHQGLNLSSQENRLLLTSISLQEKVVCTPHALMRVNYFESTVGKASGKVISSCCSSKKDSQDVYC